MHPFHVIKDPVHGTMQFTDTEDDWIKPFIDSPNFQRLRHIKQLGLGDLIFPGAVHTRLNHGMGCCYVASQISHKIDLSDKDRQLVMLACLLHDIGHGPCSHAFEDLFVNRAIAHEDWTPMFLRDYLDPQFIERYNKRNPNFPLAENLLNDVMDLIMHRKTKHTLLADIVSSQLDADRLDYLLRDSHFCGVAYGQYDFKWMLHCLTPIDTKEGQRLGVSYRGVGVVEHYLMARRLMMRNIYHHQKKYAAELMLTHLLKLLSKKITVDSELAKTPLGKFLMAVEKFNVGRMSKEDFINKNFVLYKQLTDFDVASLVRHLADQTDSSDITLMAQRVHHRQLPKVYRLWNKDLDDVRNRLNDFKKSHESLVRPWQMTLIEKPHQSYSDGQGSIWVVGRHESVRSIREESLFLDAMSDRLEAANFLAVDSAVVGLTEVQQFVDSLE